MRAEDPLELETLVPQALALKAPVLIDVPFAEMPIPRAPQFAPLYNLPWTQPQEGSDHVLSRAIDGRTGAWGSLFRHLPSMANALTGVRRTPPSLAPHL